MGSTKRPIEQECADCGTWTDQGELVSRKVLNTFEQSGWRRQVWLCRPCLRAARNWEQVETALTRLERRTLGVVKRFRC